MFTKRKALISLGTVVILLAVVVFSAVWSENTTHATVPAQETRVECDPIQLAVYENRIQIRCASPAIAGSNIVFFSTPLNQSNSDEFLTLAATALNTNMTLRIAFDAADESGASYRCDPQNCRLIMWMSLDE